MSQTSVWFRKSLTNVGNEILKIFSPTDKITRICEWASGYLEPWPCRCAYPQKILIQLYLGVAPFFNLEIWPKSKILLKIVRQHNSTETAQQNFVKLCSYEGHNVYIWIFTGNADLIFFKEQFISLLNFGQNYFVQLRWIWFSVRLPVTNAWNCHLLYTAFSSNVGALGMWACSLFSLIFLNFIFY